jgi:carbon-monoxide dehydrogenase small subunit
MTGGVIYLNGVAVRAPHPGMRLLDWLRDDAGERGPKEGCAVGQCGACTVLIDGRPAVSCCMLVHTALGRRVWTASGLMTTGIGRIVREKFAEYGAIQCGFCAPGMTVAGVAWLAGTGTGAPCRAEVAEALSGNLCRCSGYAQLIDALLAARLTRQGTPS